MLLKIAGSTVAATFDIKFPTGNGIAVIFFKEGQLSNFF
jgi:hypothetical protein